MSMLGLNAINGLTFAAVLCVVASGFALSGAPPFGASALRRDT